MMGSSKDVYEGDDSEKSLPGTMEGRPRSGQEKAERAAPGTGTQSRSAWRGEGGSEDATKVPASVTSREEDISIDFQ